MTGKFNSIRLNRPVLLVAAAVLIVLALLTGEPLVFYLAYAATAIIVLAFLWTRRIAAELRVARTLRSSSVQVGDTVEEVFELANTGSLPMLWIELNDRSTLPGYTAARVETLGGHEEKHWTVQGICERRGLYMVGPLTVRVGDPFGLFVASAEYAKQTAILVYPPLVDLPGLQLPQGRLAGSARTSLRSLELTTDAAGVRDYHAGDALSRIHWLSTARRNRLQVKEFDLEPAGNIWIIADLYREVQAGSGSESTEEYIVQVCSSLLTRAVRDNKAVGFAAQGQQHHLVMPDKGARQLWRVLRELAAARAFGTRPLADVLRETVAVMGRGMTVVIITPSPAGLWVDELLGFERRGLAVAVVLVDAASFGGHVPPATATTALLGQAGLPSFIISQGQQFQTVGGERKKKIQRVLGSGRAWRE